MAKSERANTSSLQKCGCHEIFELSPKGHARIRQRYRGENELEGIISEELPEKARRATASCLGSAISIEEIENS